MGIFDLIFIFAYSIMSIFTVASVFYKSSVLLAVIRGVIGLKLCLMLAVTTKSISELGMSGPLR